MKYAPSFLMPSPTCEDLYLCGTLIITYVSVYVLSVITASTHSVLYSRSVLYMSQVFTAVS